MNGKPVWNRDHPSEAMLDAYLDAELGRKAGARVTEHVEGCNLCSRRIDDGLRVRKLLRESVPTSGEFSSDGEFWVRLSTALEPRRGPSLLTYVPPVVLTMVTVAMQVAMVASGLVLLLVRFRVLRAPPMAPLDAFGAWMSELAARVGLDGLGMSEAVRDLGMDAQTVLAIAVWVIMGAVLGAVVLLLAWWAVCVAFRPTSAMFGSWGKK